MGINRVDFGGRTLIDLIGTTATAETILSGFGAYGKDGEWMDGKFEFETGEYEPTTNVSHPEIPFANSHSVPPSIAGIVDATGTDNTTTQRVWSCMVFNWYRAYGTTVSYASNSDAYGYAYYTYRSNSANSLSSAGIRIQYPDTNSNTAGTAYMRFWLTKDKFKPYGASNSRYFQAGRTYKWFAIWL